MSQNLAKLKKPKHKDLLSINQHDESDPETFLTANKLSQTILKQRKMNLGKVPWC